MCLDEGMALYEVSKVRLQIRTHTPATCVTRQLRLTSYQGDSLQGGAAPADEEHEFEHILIPTCMPFVMLPYSAA